MVLRLVFIIAFFCVGTPSHAQKKRKSSKNEDLVTSVEPYYPERNDYVSKKATGTEEGAKNSITYKALEDSKKQRHRVNKQKLRAERELEKAQNIELDYFGHRNPPKRRSPTKIRYCKRCQIKH